MHGSWVWSSVCACLSWNQSHMLCVFPIIVHPISHSLENESQTRKDELYRTSTHHFPLISVCLSLSSLVWLSASPFFSAGCCNSVLPWWLEQVLIPAECRLSPPPSMGPKPSTYLPPLLHTFITRGYDSIQLAKNKRGMCMCIGSPYDWPRNLCPSLVF